VRKKRERVEREISLRKSDSLSTLFLFYSHTFSTLKGREVRKKRVRKKEVKGKRVSVK
jgi:hypothetical protein